MYEQRYGTDWDELTVDAAIERAYALGVQAAWGETDEEEFEQLRAVLAGYDQSLVDLAYEEGKAEATERRREVDSREAVWEALVDADADPPEPDDGGAALPTDGDDALPESLSTPEFLASPDRDGREAVRLPPFLKRD